MAVLCHKVPGPDNGLWQCLLWRVTSAQAEIRSLLPSIVPEAGSYIKVVELEDWF